MNCRFCNAPLNTVFVDLVNSPASNSFLTKEQLNETEAYHPLKVYCCDQCFLVQLDEFKKAGDIFSSDYVYFSSYSSSWLQHAKAYVEKMTRRFGYAENSNVIEIASNDGYLLQYFKEKNIPVLGIEPTLGTAEVAIAKGVDTMVRFFGTELAGELSASDRKADLLLGNNVLAHVPDINDFVEGMNIALKPSGVVTMEFPHLLQLVRYTQFDTIYHEHFSYLSLIAVRAVFKAHGLRVFDVEELPTHGGSLRVYACHEENEHLATLPSVEQLISKEKSGGLDSSGFFKGFTEKVQRIKNDFLQFLLKANAEGKKVAAYGAAAKGNTLLNYCGVKNDLVSFVVDRNPAKQNKFLPGSHIPVVAEEWLQQERPDYIVIFPWNIKDEVMEQLEYVREWGAGFVIAIPSLSIN